MADRKGKVATEEKKTGGGKNYENRGPYVIASSQPPERHRWNVTRSCKLSFISAFICLSVYMFLCLCLCHPVSVTLNTWKVNHWSKLRTTLVIPFLNLQ